MGEGSPIIFLHSGLQTGETDFIDQQKYFKENYTVIVPDLRAHGKSSVERIDIHKYFDESANDLMETMDYLGLDDAHVVGCSLGALVGLVFAKKFPERISSLSLSGIISVKPDNWEELSRQDINMQRTVLNNVEAVGYFDSIHESDWQEFLRQSMEQDWYPFNKTGDVSTLKCATLYIVGEDKKHEVSGITSYPSQNELIHIAVVPFAGHLVHNEQPKVYSEILELFIRKAESR